MPPAPAARAVHGGHRAGPGRPAAALAARASRRPPARRSDPASPTSGNGRNGQAGRTGRPGSRPALASPGQTGIWGEDATPQRSDIPTAVPSPMPTSATFAPAGPAAPRVATPVRARSRGCDPSATPTTSPTPAIRRRPASASSTSCRRRRSSTTSRIPLEAGGERGGPPAERGDHRQEAGGLQHPGADRRAERRPGRDPVRGPAGRRTSRSAGSRRSSDDLAMALAARSLRIEAPIPGKSAVGIEIPNKDFNIVALRRILEEVDFTALRLEADLRPRSRRGGQGAGGRPGQDAAPADRRRDRLGQERHGQRAHHEPAVRGDAGRRADDPDGPQAGRARGLQRPAAPARAGHHRARAGQGRAQVGGQRDGGPLPAPGRRHGPQHHGRSTRPGPTPRTGCRTSSSSSTSSPT